MSSSEKSFGSGWVVLPVTAGEKASSTRSQRPITVALRCGAGRKQATVTTTGEEATAATMLSSTVRKQQSRRGSNNRND
ncbi:hypothetical protein ACOSQ3_022261 [Xanthoceras sorbifolium]